MQLAIAETERLLGRPLRELLVDALTGEIRPIALVTDNGRCFKAARFAAYIERRPELIHIRTRRKSPQQNGVRERAFGSLKYEHLYRLEIDDGHQLGAEVESYRHVFNTIRPHEHLDWRQPLDVHLEACNSDQTLNSNSPKPCQLRDAGQSTESGQPQPRTGQRAHRCSFIPLQPPATTRLARRPTEISGVSNVCGQCI